MPRLLIVAIMTCAVPASAEWVPEEFPCSVPADPLQSYVGQSTCLSNPQPAVAAFREMILDAFPETIDLGIMRKCSVGGTSEHKEGRAWDWGVLATKPSQKAIAEGVLAALLETDECKNKVALVRRLGIMYMIWNKKVWKSYQASSGWQTYYGSNPHTDHVHFSFSWPGAKEQTSYWSGKGVAPDPEKQPACTPAAVAGAEGEVFKDMPKSALGYKDALSLYEAGITNGCQNEPKLFCPSCPTARYQAVVFLLRAMGADVSSPPAAPSFDDVPKSAWYFPYVEKAKALGMTTGCTATSFCPNDVTTRAQMAKFIVHATGWPTVAPAKATFADVKSTDWFYKSVETIKASCVTNGCGDGVNFCPDDTLTRAQAAIFVARAFDLNDANKCLDYCDASLCAEGAFCDAWSQCAGFSDTCDETGTQSRACYDFEDCSKTSTDPDCGEVSTTESQACKRDTDGIVVKGWGAWSSCGGFTDACDATGTRSRTRAVCQGGKSAVETQTQPCTREVDPACFGSGEADAGSEAADAGTDAGEADTIGSDTAEAVEEPDVTDVPGGADLDNNVVERSSVTDATTAVAGGDDAVVVTAGAGGDHGAEAHAAGPKSGGCATGRSSGRAPPMALAALLLMALGVIRRRSSALRARRGSP